MTVRLFFQFQQHFHLLQNAVGFLQSRQSKFDPEEIIQQDCLCCLVLLQFAFQSSLTLVPPHFYLGETDLSNHLQLVPVDPPHDLWLRAYYLWIVGMHPHLLAQVIHVYSFGSVDQSTAVYVLVVEVVFEDQYCLFLSEITVQAQQFVDFFVFNPVRLLDECFEGLQVCLAAVHLDQVILDLGVGAGGAHKWEFNSKHAPDYSGFLEHCQLSRVELQRCDVVLLNVQVAFIDFALGHIIQEL